MRKLAFIILTIVLVPLVHAQERADIHARIRAEVAERNYLAALNDLQSLRAKELVVFETNNYDYLLARISDKSGDAASAMAGYQTVVNRNSILKEYALWHLSQIARTSGNLVLERLYLTELISFSPNSLLANAANARLARSWFDGKSYDTAIKLFNERRSSSAAKGSDQIAREELVLLADAYYRIGNTDKARETFTSIISSMANAAQPDDFALAAVKGLDLLDAGPENFGKTVPQLGDYEHLRRAQIYQFNRDFTDARLHFSAIINNHPSSGITPDAIFQIGRGYAQQSNFTEAIKWFERVQEQFPEHQVCKDALLQVAAAYARVGKSKEAISRYEKYIAQYPDDERLDRAYLNIVDVLRDHREETDALQWAVKIQQVFKGRPPEAVALFAEARLYLAKSEWQNALGALDKLRVFSDLGGANAPGGTNTTEITFLRGFALEQLRKYPEAIDAYLSLPDGRNEYYGGRATERLRLLNQDDNARFYIDVEVKENLAIANEKISTNISERRRQAENKRIAAQKVYRMTTDPQLQEKMKGIISYAYMSLPDYYYIKTISFFGIRARQCHLGSNNPLTGAPSPDFPKMVYGRCELRYEGRSYEPKRKGHFVIVEELIFLGLYDEAAPELAFALGAKDSFANLSPEDASALAWAFKSGDMANKAIAFAEPFWRKVPSDYLVELAPREAVEMLYPDPYADSLLKYASPRNVDPRFLLSIMRQESRFRPEVKSYAAARGLMQFISTTSDKIAGELGRDNFRQDELYNPPTAILFGSQYVGDLFKLFPNQPAAVAASYNGGEDNMKRWLARAKSPHPDRYVPEIVFSQSKDYVYKVMANYRIYQMLYNENLKTGAQASRLQ
jgi:soluble lytic murein transglycosylase